MFSERGVVNKMRMGNSVHEKELAALGVGLLVEAILRQ